MGMELMQVGNGVAGTSPEFGAIFMSNIATKKECFRRKLFGLPSSMANFVEQVKAGMVLFLFEFERRELYGVFRASSDGSMNIVPKAYSSSGKHFPAQVHFSPIWYCSPISEKEFHSAIMENYFSLKKFNFGLSVDQVYRLLQLFSTRKLKNKIPHRIYPQEAIRSVGEDIKVIDDANIGGSSPESNVGKSLEPALSSEHLDNSFYGIESVDNNRIFLCEKVDSQTKLHMNNEKGVWSHSPGDDVGKKRRIDDDGRFFLTSEHYENCFRKVRETTEDRRQEMRNMVWNESKVETGSGCVAPQVHLGKSLDKVSRLRNVDGELVMDDSLKKKRYIHNEHGPFCSPEKIGCHSGKVRGLADDSQYLINDVMQSEKYVDYGCSRLTSCEPLGYPNGRVKRTSKNDRFLMHEEDCFEHPNSTDYVPFSEPKQNHSLYSSKTILESDHSCIQDKYSHPFVHATEPHNFDFLNPSSHDATIKKAYPYDPEISQLCYKPHCADVPSFHSSEVNFSSKGRLSPYHLEPKGLSRCADVSLGSDSLKDAPPLHGSEVDIFFKGRTSLHLLESKVSRCFDLASHNGNDVSLASISNRHSGYDANNSFLDAGYFEDKEKRTFGHNNYSASLFSELPLTSIPLSKDEIYVKENRGPLSCSVAYGMNPSCAFNNVYHGGTQGKYEQEMLYFENDVTSAKNLSSFRANEPHLNISSREKDSVNDTESRQSLNGRHSSCRNNRASVFTRLTSASEDILQEDENDSESGHEDYMDASVDEIMDIMLQGQTHRPEKSRSFKSSNGQCDNDKIAKKKTLLSKRNQINNDHSTIINELKTDGYHSMIGSDNEVPKETRVVDFNRRSVTKKNTELTGLKDYVESFKGKTSMVTVDANCKGKKGKRRRLIRPVFELVDFNGAACQLSPSQLDCLNSVDKLASENSGKGCEKIASQDESALFLVTYDCKTMNAEENSNINKVSNLENHSSPIKCYDGEDAKKVLKTDANVQVDLKAAMESIGDGSYLKGSIVKGSCQDHLGVASCSLADQKLHSGAVEVIAEYGNCGEDKGLLQDAHSRRETSLVNSNPLDNMLKNCSSMQNNGMNKGC